VLLYFYYNANTTVLLIYDCIIHIYIVVYIIGQLMLRKEDIYIYIRKHVFICFAIALYCYNMLSRAVEFD